MGRGGEERGEGTQGACNSGRRHPARHRVPPDAFNKCPQLPQRPTTALDQRGMRAAFGAAGKTWLRVISAKCRGSNAGQIGAPQDPKRG